MVKNSCSYIKKAHGQSYLYSFPSTNRNVNLQTLTQKYNIHHKTTDVPPCSFLVLFYPVLDSLSQGLFSLLWPQTYETHAKCFGSLSTINTTKYITNNNQKIIYWSIGHSVQLHLGSNTALANLIHILTLILVGLRLVFYDQRLTSINHETPEDEGCKEMYGSTRTVRQHWPTACPDIPWGLTSHNLCTQLLESPWFAISTKNRDQLTPSWAEHHWHGAEVSGWVHHAQNYELTMK